MRIPVGNFITVDYKLVEPPVFGDNYIESFHKVCDISLREYICLYNVHTRVYVYMRVYNYVCACYAIQVLFDHYNVDIITVIKKSTAG